MTTLRECEICAATFRVYPSRPNRKHCSRNCWKTTLSASRSGSGNPHWKGGAYIDTGGYRYIQARDHPRASNHGYVREHIIVMEKTIGRKLAKGEKVHHINGDKLDNRPENLEIWHRGHPTGVRLSDQAHCPTCTCGS